MTRRDFIAGAGAATLAPVFPIHGAGRESYADQFPDMLLAYLGGRLTRLAEQWDRVRGEIRTAAQVQARNRFVREKYAELLGPFPERCPLDAHIVRRLERKGYRIEILRFQSRPDFWVTGSLYLPASGGPFPGIIAPCGHGAGARLQPNYQLPCLSLVSQGFAVLTFDPIGQGERRQYYNPHTGETESDLTATYEHSMSGQLLLLMGENLTNYRVWDGMRAIDYLLSRPDIDPRRIGCAGLSGGGTLTLFISALDERVRCAVVNEGGTSHRWPPRFPPGAPVGPADVEQNLFPAAIYGIDLCDLHVAIAPRPLMATIEHYGPRFDVTAGHIRERYKQLGVPERFATEEAIDPHGWTVKLRIANTRWFCRWFLERPGPDREPSLQVEPPENLYVTPNGSVRYSRQGQTIFSLIHSRQAALRLPRLPAPGSEPGLRERIESLLGCARPDHPLGARLRMTTPRKGYRVEKLEFLSEPGIYIPTWVFVPDGASGRLPAILYLHEGGKEVDGLEAGRLEGMVLAGKLVVAIDVRGIGETRPAHGPSSTATHQFRHLFDVETAMSYMAWFMDESLLGMRVRDVRRAVDYALSRPDVDPSSLTALGRGMGALWGLYAAALDARITALVCERGLLSYRALTLSDRYLHGANVFIRNVLQHFDLPQVAGLIAARPLTLDTPVDAMKRPVPPAQARDAYEYTRQAYGAAGAPSRFEILGT